MTQHLLMGQPPNHLQQPVSSWSVPGSNDNDPMAQIFDQFCSADTFQVIMERFQQLCDATCLCPSDHIIFYQQLKTRLMSWKAQSLWSKLDKRANDIEYKRGMACNNTRVLVIGAGPCGLRVAIEMALLGAKTVIVEKRDSFSRNNVLHLWPFLIQDLKALGAKLFFGKFCAGSIDHISIQTLQCILLKVALLVGVEVHSGVSFESFLEPVSDRSVKNTGWRARVFPASHPVSEFIFDVCFSADGKRNTMTEFKRKELRGKFAIGITANFINRKSQAEASVEEISGVSYIFNQKFFKDLHGHAGIDLENIVYYKDETHYFVMTAKKPSLLCKGVLRQDYDDPELLLAKENVNQDALLNYVQEAAEFSTNHQLPNLEFAPNYSGQPDVDMFDFTSMFSAEHACRVVERRGHQLLIGLVGDTLLEPFWPTGSGCARGFLGALDGAWMVRSWTSGEMTPLEVVAERESIYQLLSQTKPDNLNKNHANYTIDPNTRYPNLKTNSYKPHQVQSLYDGTEGCNDVVQCQRHQNHLYDSLIKRQNLLRWFKRELESYEDLVKVVDLTLSWQSGLAFCAFLHKYRPHLINVFTLDPSNIEHNNQLAFDILEKHFNITPVTNGQQIAQWKISDELMISYLSRIHGCFRQEKYRSLRGRKEKKSSSERSLNISQDGRTHFRRTKEFLFSHLKNEGGNESVTINPLSVLNSLKYMREIDVNQNAVNSKKTLLKSNEKDSALEKSSILKDDSAILHHTSRKNKVADLAKELASKFRGESIYTEDQKQNVKPVSYKRIQSTDTCYFCKDAVHVTERCIAESLLFHLQCFRCEYCANLLNPNSYSLQMNDDGKEIFCHLHCHEAQVKKKENPFKLMSSYKSWNITPVDRATFDATRKLLIRQSKLKRNETKKKEYNPTVSLEENVVLASSYDAFSSSTEEELLFSSESDSEKPDLSWDEMLQQRTSDVSPFNRNSINLSPVNSQEDLIEEKSDGGGSDADWETESTDSESNTPLLESESTKSEHPLPCELKKSVEPDDPTAIPCAPQMEKNSSFNAVQETRLLNRKASFFNTVAQPVRIDARQFLGLETTQDVSEKSETSVDVSKNNTEDKTKNDEDETRENLHVDSGDVNQGVILEKQKELKREKHKKRHKKKSLEVQKKRLTKTKQQTDKRKTEKKKPCKTAITSSMTAAVHQTVALVPLSGEESSSEAEESLETRGSRSILEDADKNSASDVSGENTQASREETSAAFQMEKLDKELLKVDSAHFVSVPRPGLLVAEAMFKSCEESVVVASTSGSEESLTSTNEEGRTEPCVIEGARSVDEIGNFVEEEEEEEGHQETTYQMQCLSVDSEIKSRESLTKQGLKKAKSDDLIYAIRLINDYNQNDCVNKMLGNADVQSFLLLQTNIYDKVQKQESIAANNNNTLKHGLSQKDRKTEAGLKTSAGEKMDILYDNKKQNEVEDCLSRNINIDNRSGDGAKYPHSDEENLLQSEPGSMVGSICQEVDLEIKSLECGENLGNVSLQRLAPKAETESLSEDDNVCQNPDEEVFNFKSRSCNENESAESKSLLIAKDSEAELIHLNDRPVASLDPMSRLNSLLDSLSSSKHSDTEQLACVLSLNDEQNDSLSDHNKCNIDDKQLKLQHSKEQELFKKEEEKNGKIRHIGRIEGDGILKSHCDVDENINYISSSSGNSLTTMKDELGDYQTATVDLGQCPCMKDKTKVKLELYQTTGNAKMDVNILDAVQGQGLTIGEGIKSRTNIKDSSMSLTGMNQVTDIQKRNIPGVQEGKLIETDVCKAAATTDDFSENLEAERDQSIEDKAHVGRVGKHEEIASKSSSRNDPTTLISPTSLLDAKRKFFQAVSQPVRINPHDVFKDDFLLRRNVASNKPSEKVIAGGENSSVTTSNTISSDILVTDGKKEQISSDLHLIKAQEKKKRLLPDIPRDQIPLDLGEKALSFRCTSEADCLKIRHTTEMLNNLSLSESEIHRKAKEGNRRSLPSSDLFPKPLKFIAVEMKSTEDRQDEQNSVFIDENEPTSHDNNPCSSNCLITEEGLIKTVSDDSALRTEVESSIKAEPRICEIKLEESVCLDNLGDAQLDIPNDSLISVPCGEQTKIERTESDPVETLLPDQQISSQRPTDVALAEQKKLVTNVPQVPH